jgi:hypothetical protein
MEFGDFDSGSPRLACTSFARDANPCNPRRMLESSDGDVAERSTRVRADRGAARRSRGHTAIDLLRAMTRTIAVDWSGAVHGVRKKLWLAEARDGALVRLECGRDRSELVAHLIELARVDRELVVGLDFAFSFPEWFLVTRGVRDAPSLWSLVERHGEEWLSACDYPFWGKRGKTKPAPGRTPTLYRRTESEHLPVRGIVPKSVFQVGGAGAVGTGSLRGMPWLARLADAGFAIWPFHAPRLPLVLEIYPRFLTGPVTKSSTVARGLHLARHCARQDRELVARAASGEDAFDAALSALALNAHVESIARLHEERDETYRLEGRIWRPVEDPLFAS